MAQTRRKVGLNTTVSPSVGKQVDDLAMTGEFSSQSNIVEIALTEFFVRREQREHESKMARLYSTLAKTDEGRKLLEEIPTTDKEKAEALTRAGVAHVEAGEIEALTYNAAYRIYRVAEEKAGLKKVIHPHLMKHYAVTNWILDGLSEQQITHRAGWVKGSAQMQKVYGNWTEQEMNDGIWEHYGLKTEDRRQVTLKKCPRCGNILKAEDRFCSQCALVLDHAALQELQAYESDLMRVLELLKKENGE